MDYVVQGVWWDGGYVVVWRGYVVELGLCGLCSMWCGMGTSLNESGVIWYKGMRYSVGRPMFCNVSVRYMRMR